MKSIQRTAPVDVALAYARAGIPVFPCSHREFTRRDGKRIKSKQPLVRWRDESTCDPAKVQELWNQHPDALIGIDCGKAGLIVVDLDRHHSEKDGVAHFAKLAAKNNYTYDGAVVMTAGGGQHLYFMQAAEMGFGNSAGEFTGLGIDVRGDGGYVIASGSKLDNGRTWKKGLFSSDLIDSFVNNSIPVLPDWIVRKLRASPPKKTRDRSSADIEHEVVFDASSKDDSHAISLTRQEAEALAATPPGERNNALNKAAYKLGIIAGKGDLACGTARAALRQACELNGLIESDGVDAFKSTFSSGFERGLKDAPDIEFEDERPTRVGSDETDEPPRPLFRDPGKSEPFPIDALGEVLGDAVRAIVDRIQVPEAIAAQSALTAVTLAIQPQADVALPYGSLRPLSAYFITEAESGERKTAADDLAMRAISEREEELRVRYGDEMDQHRRDKDAYETCKKQALKEKDKSAPSRHQVAEAIADLGPEPRAPLLPMIVCPEPTYEGFVKALDGGQPGMGLCSSEGGQFVGGHGMSPENRLKTAAGLSSLWDGAPIKRVRAGDGASMIAGRRVAMHLMMQPAVSRALLSDPLLVDQGLLSRCLVVAPESTVGTRFQRELDPNSEPALKRYEKRLREIMREPMPLRCGTRNELDPRPLYLSAEAEVIWREFSDEIEGKLVPNGPYRPIRGFAGKLLENATRLAGILTLFDNFSAGRIRVDAMQRGITLARYYATEALRLIGASAIPIPLREAQLLLDWARAQPERSFSLREAYRYGPNSIRDAARAKAAISVLKEHGWLCEKEQGWRDRDGAASRRAWSIVDGD